eukprot:312285-Rhodomonas_salina.1
MCQPLWTIATSTGTGSDLDVPPPRYRYFCKMKRQLLWSLPLTGMALKRADRASLKIENFTNRNNTGFRTTI